MEVIEPAAALGPRGIGLDSVAEEALLDGEGVLDVVLDEVDPVEVPGWLAFGAEGDELVGLVLGEQPADHDDVLVQVLNGIEHVLSELVLHQAGRVLHILLDVNIGVVRRVHEFLEVLVVPEQVHHERAQAGEYLCMQAGTGMQADAWGMSEKNATGFRTGRCYAGQGRWLQDGSVAWQEHGSGGGWFHRASGRRAGERAVRTMDELAAVDRWGEP